MSSEHFRQRKIMNGAGNNMMMIFWQTKFFFFGRSKFFKTVLNEVKMTRNRLFRQSPAPKNDIKKNFTCEIHHKWGVFTSQPCYLSLTILSRDEWGNKHGKAFYEGLDRKRTHNVTALIAHFGPGCRKPNIKQREFVVWFGARDYGESLDVGWYLAVKPSFFKRFVSSFFKLDIASTLSMTMTVIEQQDARAYLSLVHYAVQQAVREIMEELGQDTGKLNLNSRSKGFLEVW